MTDLEKIVAFVERNHVVTICSAKGGVPWAANCFYVLDQHAMALVVMSEPKTRHASEWLENDLVAGTISNQEASVARLQGIQYTARTCLLEGADKRHAFQLYLKRFPIAAVHSAPIWHIALETVKFTDNTLGFGSKMLWERN